MPEPTDTSRIPRTPRASWQHWPSACQRMVSSLRSSASAGRFENDATRARRSSLSNSRTSAAPRIARRSRASFRSSRISAGVRFTCRRRAGENRRQSGATNTGLMPSNVIPTPSTGRWLALGSQQMPVHSAAPGCWSIRCAGPSRSRQRRGLGVRMRDRHGPSRWWAQFRAQSTFDRARPALRCAQFIGISTAVPGTVPIPRPEDSAISSAFLPKANIRKTVALERAECRARKCHLLVYLQLAVRWLSGRKRRFAKPL